MDKLDQLKIVFDKLNSLQGELDAFDRVNYEELKECIKSGEWYEIISKDIGIDPLTLHLALTNGIYNIQNGFEKPLLIVGDNLKPANLLCKGHVELFEDFGITWFLTKEQMINSFKEEHKKNDKGE